MTILLLGTLLPATQTLVLLLVFVFLCWLLGAFNFVTHTLRVTSTIAGQAAISGQFVDAGTTDIEIPTTGIPASTTNQNFTLAFTLANVQFWLFQADQPITIKTNSTGSPGNTLTLTAGQPLSWSRSSGVTQTLSADVTTIYVTTTVATQFQARVISN